MLCDIEIISIIRINHLTRMFLLSCKDFAKYLKEADCEPFFYAQSNIFSLLNCTAVIKKYGSLGGIWERKDRAFVRCVKSEISIMHYKNSHLLSLLKKLLRTKP